MEAGAFDPQSEHFDLGWTVPTRPEVCEEKTKEPLGSYVSEDFHLPFVRVFGRLSQEAETWNMLNLALLQTYDPGLKALKHFFYQLWIRIVKDTVTEKVPDEPEPFFVLKKNAGGYVFGMVLIGVDFPAVFDRELKNALRLADISPCLTEGRQQPMGRVKEPLLALAAWDINWEDSEKAIALESFTACQTTEDCGSVLDQSDKASP